MTSEINNPGAFYSTGAYISECRRLSLQILPPDVTFSIILFTKEGDAIRVGLFVVFELSEKAQKELLMSVKKRDSAAFTILW